MPPFVSDSIRRSCQWLSIHPPTALGADTATQGGASATRLKRKGEQQIRYREADLDAVIESELSRRASPSAKVLR